MRTVLLFCLLAFSASRAVAANYYFSALTGDDNRTAQQAQSPSTPWKSIDRLNAFATSLKPGDSVLFRRGDTFFGTLVARVSGVPGNVIYYGAYGSGALPVITGFTAPSAWTQHSNPNIYYASLDMPNLSMVAINGEAKSRGRFPNTGFLNYESNTGNTSITDNQLSASPNWTGAEIVMRKYRFILDRHTVTSHVGTKLNYSLSTLNGNNGEFSPESGNGYFFQNHLQTLDLFGEWFYDEAAKRLYVYFGGSPAGYTVKASTLAVNAAVEAVNYITLENLVFEGGNLKGLSVAFANNIIVQNCEFYNQGATSLHGDYVSNVTVKGGLVSTSFSNGINFEHDANFCTIDGVTVNNSNIYPGTGRSGSGVGMGISVTGNNTTIINNRVSGAGYSGIQFLGNNVLVERNFIEQFCKLKDDGGGVYTFNGAGNQTLSNRKIKNNIILNAIGSFAGAEKYYYEPFGKAAGIYLDEFVNNVEITGNTIANGDWGGIFLHNAYNCLITDNIIYNFRYQVHVSQYTAATRNNTMLNNQYIARTASQYTWYYRTFVADNPGTMGTFNNNYYARPINDNQTILIDNNFGNSWSSLNITLAQWKAYGLDAASQKAPLTYASNIDDNLRFEYNATNTVKTVALNANYIDVKGTQYAGSIGLPPFTSVVLFKTTAVFPQNQVITFPAIADKVFGDPVFALNATSTSGLPVTYSVVSGPAMVAGNMVTITGVGEVVIQATQAGNASFKAAEPVTQTFKVLAPVTQTINFPAIPFKTFGDAPFQLNATASSGLPVSYQVISGLASVSGNTVTLNGAAISTIIIEATQTGNATFRAAPPVRRSFTIVRGQHYISFGALPGKAFGDAAFALTATLTSGLPVVYKIVVGPATVSGNIITLTGSGEVIVEASHPGNSDYDPASAVSRNFYVSRGSQTITFPTIGNKRVGDPPFALAATASSGLPVTYQVTAGSATVSGNMVTVTGPGEIWIQASQAGNENYYAAASLSKSFVASVTKQAQTITFPSVGSKTFGSAPFNLAATASSGLPVSYTVLSGPATVAGNTVTLTGAGTVSIRASQAGNSTYNAAPFVTQNIVVNKGSQTINFPAIPNKTQSDPPFQLAATAASGLPVSYKVNSGPATVSGNTVTITGVGEVWIEASQPGNGNYNPAPVVTRNFFVSSGAVKQSQNITFDALPNRTFGDAPFALAATASSGLPVAYQVVSGAATVAGNIVTLTGAGPVSIEATQPGDATFHAATPVVRNFTVAKGSQVINFPVIPGKTTNDAPFQLAATASSGLPISYAVLSGPATVSGNTVTITGAGLVTIEATQAGNAAYNAAAPVSQSFNVQAFTVKQNQTINFGSLPYRTFSNPPFDLLATSSSGLPVEFRVVSGPVAINGKQVTITGVGNVVIEATQPGDGTYNAATPVQRGFTIGKAGQSLNFPNPPGKTAGDAPFALTATATSGLPVQYTVVSGPATVSGNIVTLTGPGTVVIEATQPGDANWNAAFKLTRSFTVAPSNGTKQNQSITFGALSNKTFGDAPFALAATASSGLPVLYLVTSGPATIAGNTVTITGAGNVTIEASQPGDGTFNPAVPVSQSFAVAKAAQTISFGALPNRTLGDAPFNLAATASSGLPVSYSVVSGPAAISGSTVTMTGTGVVVIEATQAGDANVNAATPVSQNFTVLSNNTVKQSQTITFGTLAYKTFVSPPFALNATASSGLPVSFSVVSGPVSISGNTVTITGVGNVVIEATQPGDAGYHAATPVQRAFTIGKAGQSLTFPNPPNKTFGDAPFPLSATATSGLPVQYTVLSGPATVSGNTVTITGTGSVSIEAAQPGDANWNAAFKLVRNFVVVPAANSSLTVTSESKADRTGPAAELPLTVSLFPNPMRGQGFARVQTTRPLAGHLALYDREGKLVKSLGFRRFEGRRTETISLNVADMSSGLYYLRLVTRDAVVNQMFQVMK